jgi:hypothetical protein
MGSNKYAGYVGGVAVAVGVGAAIAAASQGVASAQTGKSDSSSASDSAKVDAGPMKAATGNTKRTKPASKLNDTPSRAAASDTKSASPTQTSAETTAAEFDVAQVGKVQGLFTGHAAPKAAATTGSTSSSSTTPTAGETTSVPWSPNPFRSLPPEPAPQDMPGPIWTLEQTFINVFPGLAKPVAREGFELGYRLTQMVPWVNVVVPLTNIVTDLPIAFQGDKAAAQRIINNLIVTINPVAVLYYGYNEIADILNLEAPALQLQNWGIATAWNVLDLFALLHNRGESGLPLSTSTPPPYEAVPEATATELAAAVIPSANDASTPTIELPAEPDPFRADDPAPIGMPAVMYNIEKGLVAIFPTEVRPVVRELYELSWRVSQMSPGLGAAVPIVQLLPALYQAALGHRDTAQTAINNVLLSTTPLSVLYYGYDEIADLLNVEDQAQALKVQTYAEVWDQADPNGYLHVPGHSGLPA